MASPSIHVLAFMVLPVVTNRDLPSLEMPPWAQMPPPEARVCQCPTSFCVRGIYLDGGAVIGITIAVAAAIHHVEMAAMEQTRRYARPDYGR